MALVAYKRRWKRQPQSAVEIDWSNPLSQGLAHEIVNGRDVVRNLRAAALVGAPTIARVPDLVGQEYASAVQGYGTGQVLFGPDATFQIIEQPANTSQVAGIFNRRVSYTTNNAFSLGYNYNAGNEFSVDIGTAAGGPGIAYSFDRSGFQTARPNVIVCVVQGGASAGQRIRLWLNGAPVTNTSIAADSALSSFFAGAIDTEVGRVNNATLYYAGKVFLIRAWNRALSTTEVQEVTDRPWSVRRKRTLGVPVSAAGGGVTLGAASSTQASTSSATALAQAHTLGAGASTQGQTSSATGLSQTHTLGAGASTQARTSSATGLSQTHALGAASSTQALTSSATGLGQTHALGSASSTQASTSSATGLTLGTVTVLGNASSAQGTVSTSTGLSQTHALGNASSTAATGSAATAVVQRHVLGNAASTQASSSAATGIYLGTGPVTYPLAGASQGYPLAGQSQDYPLAGIAQTYPLQGQL